jgi:hypothetical protein
MTSQQFVELSTRLMKDMKAWSEEATRRAAVTPEHLTALERAVEIVDRVTVDAAAVSPDVTE